jgi:hypothetical protein
MFARSNRSLSLCVVATFVIAGLIASTAVARIIVNTIDGGALLTDEGRHLVVTGPIICTPGERALLRVTVTQRPTGALAEGSTLFTCSGQPQQWAVHATSQGREAFVPGSATAVASARTTQHGETSDAHQWLVEVALVGD